VVVLEVPPLRTRPEDIPLLAGHYLHRLLVGLRRKSLGFSPDALRALRVHTWPGNTRELGHVVEHAVLDCASGEIGVAHLGLPAPRSRPRPKAERPALELESFKLKDMEQALVRLVLRETGGNVSAAARALGINRSTLYAKIREYGLGAAEA
jgi:two-component system response regulator HydG